MAVLLPLASFAAIAVFALGSNALDSSDLLMRDAQNATELFEIAKKDMENWHSTYLQAIKEFHEKLLPEYVCPDVSARLEILTELEEQIEKIRECRQEKFEQLDVLKGIADTMGSLNQTESLKKLEDTIEHLNNTAHAEDIELKKEEDVVMKLKVTIKDYKCDCAYNSWGHWGSCSKTCGDDGIKSRSRDVKWNPRNGGKACLEDEKESLSECNRECCPVDCTWEEWGEWSACPDECGISKVSRSREKNEHICGGVACTGKSREERNCDRFADLKMENDECQQNFFNSTEEIERLKKKLCQNVLCNNGGTCQEGDCICPDGFNGRTCAESKYEDDMLDTGIVKDDIICKTKHCRKWLSEKDKFKEWGPNFLVDMTIKINKPPAKWSFRSHRILQVTTGQNCCGVGSRIPGVWLIAKDGKPYLHVDIAMTGDQVGKDFELRMRNRPNAITILQNAGTFTVDIGGIEVWKMQTGRPSEPFNNVKVYGYSPWARQYTALADVGQVDVEWLYQSQGDPRNL